MEQCQEQFGLDQQGLDQQGLDQQGLDQQGLDQQGLDQQGVDQQGLGQRDRRRSRIGRVLAVGAIGALVLMLAACGSDDDEASPEEAFCEAGESLRSDVDSLASLDVISEGTSGLQERLDAIRSGVDELRDAGADVAADEIDALDEALDGFDEALDAAGDDLSIESAGAVGGALNDVVGAAGDVFDVWTTTCE